MKKIQNNIKGMVQSQMFIYILTMIVIGLMLFFGVQWISELIKNMDKIDATKFKTEIESAFSKIRPDYGSGKDFYGKDGFVAPKGVNKVCFVTSDYGTNGGTIDGTAAKQATEICKSVSTDYNPIICSRWKNTETSILFSPAIDADIDIGKIEVQTLKPDGTYQDSPYLCFTERNIEFRLESLGKIVIVKEKLIE